MQQADWDELYGIGDHRVYLALKDRGLPISEDEFIDQTLTYYTENKHRLKVRDGFKAAFNMLHDKGLEIATVSSGVMEQVNANLDTADIRLKTKFNLSATDIVNKGLNTKPAPDAYLEALRMLNAQ
ncbi:MAG: HAD family hydrolase, partial [Pseudomonadota bacterium]|nr:HAD family hydrolase [Pseudomonadota bacterium]